MKNCRNVILADCIPEEIEDFREGLEKSTGLKWEVVSKVSNWGRTSRWMEIKRYFTYFFVPFAIFIHRKEYDNIVGWQQFYSLIFCFFCRLFHVKKKFKVYAINYTYKKKEGFVGKIYYHFMKYIITSQYLDKAMVPSKNYVEICSKQFDIDKDKFAVLCFGVRDIYSNYKNIVIEDIALSIGRSNRDYDWLIKEWKEIDYPLIIISDTYKVPKELPSNIRIIDSVSGEEQYPYIMKSNIIILPIDEPSICSGDTVLLTSMSFKKCVIVTTPSTLAEMYVKDGENGFIVKKESGELKKCIEKAIRNNDIARKARDSYLNNYSRWKMGSTTGDIIVSRQYK